MKIKLKNAGNNVSLVKVGSCVKSIETAKIFMVTWDSDRLQFQIVNLMNGNVIFKDARIDRLMNHFQSGFIIVDLEAQEV